MPLLVKLPNPALRFIHITQQSQLSFIAVMSVLVFHHVLVKVKSRYRVGFIADWHLFPELGQHMFGFIPLLEK